MPTAPPRACSRCGATAPRGKRCRCRPAWEGTTHPHDDTQTAKLRQAKRAASPICEWPGCRHPTEHVDHIRPLAEGGSRYDWNNLQSLCALHHQQKTHAESVRGKTRPR